MKKNLAAYLAASILAIALPAAAGEHAAAHRAGDLQCEKECRMLVKNCGQASDTLQTKISRLKGEIGKGSAAYTPAELERMEQKLKDAQDTLEKMTQPS